MQERKISAREEGSRVGDDGGLSQKKKCSDVNFGLFLEKFEGPWGLRVGQSEGGELRNRGKRRALNLVEAPKNKELILSRYRTQEGSKERGRGTLGRELGQGRGTRKAGG